MEKITEYREKLLHNLKNQEKINESKTRKNLDNFLHSFDEFEKKWMSYFESVFVVARDEEIEAATIQAKRFDSRVDNLLSLQKTQAFEQIGHMVFSPGELDDALERCVGTLEIKRFIGKHFIFI